MQNVWIPLRVLGRTEGWASTETGNLPQSSAVQRQFWCWPMPCSNSPTWVSIRWKKNSIYWLLQNWHVPVLQLFVSPYLSICQFSSPLSHIKKLMFSQIVSWNLGIPPCFVTELVLFGPTSWNISSIFSDVLWSTVSCAVFCVNNVETQDDLNSWRQLHRPTCSVTWSPKQLPGFPMATMFLFLQT